MNDRADGFPSRSAGWVVAGLLTLVVYGLLMLLSRFRQPVGFAVYGLVWLFLVHLGLWTMFTHLERHLGQRWPSPRDSPRRVSVYVILGLASGIVFFDLVYVGMRFFEAWIGGDGELSIGHLGTATGLGAILSTVVGAVVLARGNLERWRNAEETVHALEQERAALELVALRRQLDPHFLFNSLNTLAALIDEAPDTAQAFVEELAEVYRHVLRGAERDIVPLDDELRSATALAFLFQQRFEQAFRWEVEIEPPIENSAIVPLALHTLLENAVQHNVATREQPLVVSLVRRGDRLEMRNPRQPKPHRGSHGVGLENLRRSYELLGAGPVRVQSNETTFTVSLPLLETPDARRDHRG
ncbi:MAG: histidine kinase [Acidobacteriota bacterium]